MSFFKIKKIMRKYLPKWFFNFLIKIIWRRFILFIYINTYKKFKLRNFKNEIQGSFSLDNLNFKIFLNRKNGSVDERIYLKNHYEPEILRIIKNNSSKKDTFLDIGANIGQHSLFASHFFKRVVSFEPIPKLFTQFNKSIKLNNISNIKVYNLGCSDRKETKIIYEKFSNIGGSSLIEKKKYDKKEKINLIKLDDFLRNQKIHFIKIDIEGYEYFAFKGMRKILEKYKPKIVFEFSPILYDKIDSKMSLKILDLLHKLNYQISDINNNEKVVDFKTFLKNTKHQTNLFCKQK